MLQPETHEDGRHFNVTVIRDVRAWVVTSAGTLVLR